jgi:2-dehydro-3-deoxyphosphooctonate aldolase (KDO 8-P synthase)
METAEVLARLRDRESLELIFKSSFDKANRTSIDSYRGPGMESGLRLLEEVGEQFDLPLVTDIHRPDQAEPVAEVVDLLQIPAFLSRQTDLLVAAAETGSPVNVKKGQFLAPEDMDTILEKARRQGNEDLMVTERGTVFGYHNWVVDMTGLITMRESGAAVVYDATHSIQLPAGEGTSSGGEREFIAPQARAAVGVGVDAVFMETHPNPDEALSDGPNMLPLDRFERVVRQLVEVHRVTGKRREERVITDE